MCVFDENITQLTHKHKDKWMWKGEINEEKKWFKKNLNNTTAAA